MGFAPGLVQIRDPWAPQGTRIAFSSNQGSTVADDLFLRDADSDEPASMVILMDHLQHPKQSMTEDQILVESGSTLTGLWTVRTDGTGLAPYLDDPEVDLDDIAVSPDRRWAAYQSNETGEEAGFVRSVPTPRQRTRISVGEGQYPRWSPDGRTVDSWLAEDAAVDTPMAADIVTEPTFAVVERTPVLIGAFESEHWDLHQAVQVERIGLWVSLLPSALHQNGS